MNAGTILERLDAIEREIEDQMVPFDCTEKAKDDAGVTHMIPVSNVLSDRGETLLRELRLALSDEDVRQRTRPESLSEGERRAVDRLMQWYEDNAAWHDGDIPALREQVEELVRIVRRGGAEGTGR